MIDVCFESYGAIAHVVDSLLASGVFLRPKLDAEPMVADWSTLRSELSFEDSVRQRASQLPIPQARAIWLVDVCGANYSEAAVETGATRDEFASHVAEGRQTIRQSVLTWA